MTVSPMARYCVLMALMYIVSKCITAGAPPPVDPEDDDPKTPPRKKESCCSALWFAQQCGVVDKASGAQLGLCTYFTQNHDLLKLCFNGNATVNDEITCKFKLLEFGFGVMFTTSIALMFQSVSIGASSHVVVDACDKVVHDGSSTISQHSTSTVSTSDGGWGTPSEFEDVGGWYVVQVCTALKMVEGHVRP